MMRMNVAEAIVRDVLFGMEAMLDVDFSTLEKLPKKNINSVLKYCFGDCEWRVKAQSGWLYFLILVFFEDTLRSEKQNPITYYMHLFFHDLDKLNIDLTVNPPLLVAPAVVVAEHHRWKTIDDVHCNLTQEDALFYPAYEQKTSLTHLFCVRNDKEHDIINDNTISCRLPRYMHSTHPEDEREREEHALRLEQQFAEVSDEDEEQSDRRSVLIRLIKFQVGPIPEKLLLGFTMLSEQQLLDMAAAIYGQKVVLDSQRK